jgi:putative ABC transport system permease protein
MRRFFAARMALREARSSVRRVGVFLGAVALGVAALTGLHGFQRDAADGSRAEARALLGGDLRFQASEPFPEPVVGRIDSLEAAGARVTRGVSLASVVSVPSTRTTRLMQVNAVDPAFPLVGTPLSEPADAWARFLEGGGAVADPAVLHQLGVGPGDTLRLGQSRVVVRGAVTGLPVDVGVRMVVGPPVFVLARELEGSGLLGFGAVAQYRAFVALPEGEGAEAVGRGLRGDLAGTGVSVRTATQEAESLAEGFRNLARFLGLVGLVALLLGGIGVASAVHLYVRERIPSVAVLRCLGAREGTVFRAYLFQAVALGAGGAFVGVVLGTALQFSLPALLAGILPFELRPRVRPVTLLAGMGIGTWVALVFALLPLLRVREIPPLAALRSEVEEDALHRLAPRIVVVLALGASLLALSAHQTGGWVQGAVLAGAVGAVLLMLAGVAWVLARAARALVPARAPFALRQGISGLFRPGNQTSAVLTALGFGAFLMGSLLVVEAGLRAALSPERSGGTPALVLFDVQTDQRSEVESLLLEQGVATTLIPVVPARLSAVDGVPVDSLAGRPGAPRWAYRRIYRNTWRPELVGTERVTAGAWWNGERDETDGRVSAAVAAGARRVSLEDGLAAELGVGVGDLLEWDVQGRPVRSVISSLRAVEWGSFSPNFFAVFEPGALDGAPTTWIGLVPLMEPEERNRVQEVLLASFPNVSFLDVSSVLETVERITSRVLQVLSALAAFVTLGGFLVLLASLLTGRERRRRESALLKTLGARAPTIRAVLLAEYGVLGAVGGASGLLLGAGGGAALLRWVFQQGWVVPWSMLLGVWAGITLLTVIAGWSISGPVLREPPLVVLRETH